MNKALRIFIFIAALFASVAAAFAIAGLSAEAT
jgi:hypothetical protein